MGQDDQLLSEQWTTFFQEAYVCLYMPFLHEEKTAREFEGMSRILNLPAGGSLLDLGCAYGRHTLLYAQGGYRATGLDLNERFLQQAQAEAEKRHLQVGWVKGDMRHLPFTAEFDGIVSLFTSFGFFGDAGNQQTLLQVQKALKPGGKFLLDTLQQSRILRAFSPQGTTRYNNGLIAIEERHFDLLTPRYHVRETLIFPDGARRDYPHSLRVYTATEMIRLLEEVGMSVIACYGSLEGDELGLDSRLVVVSEKPANVMRYV